MRSAFLKALRWFFIAACVTGGTTALMMSEETKEMEPVIFGIAGYGIAYVMMAVWKDLRGKALGAGIAVYLAISIFCPKMQDVLYVLFGYEEEINPFLLWFATLTVIGIPVMTLIYKKIK